MLLLVPSPELITCFAEGNSANFSLISPCVESKGCSLDGWEKDLGSHPIAGLAVAGKGVCGVAPHQATKARAGDVDGATPVRWGQQCPPAPAARSLGHPIFPAHINHPCTIAPQVGKEETEEAATEKLKLFRWQTKK